MSETSRLFVALWLPEGVLDDVAAALPRELSELRWQPQNRWHLTVAFLGDRSVGDASRRFSRLKLPPALPVRLRSAGTFGAVLWLGVEGGWLSDLSRAVRTGLGVADRGYRPHVTLARARTAAGRHQQQQAVDRLSGFTSNEWTPDSLTLVRSTLGPAPVYEVIGRRAFPTP